MRSQFSLWEINKLTTFVTFITLTYRIYPTEEQIEHLSQSFGCARFVYNNALAEKIKAYEERKESISSYTLIKRITTLKQEYEWLKVPTAQSLQQSILHLDSAYKRFFKEKKWFPKFHKKQGRQSLNYPQWIKVFEKTIQIPKLWEVEYRKDRWFEWQVKTCTVKKTPTNKYFISILVDDWKEPPEKVQSKDIIGIDLWIKEFAVLSNWERIQNQKFLRENIARLKVLQRRASKKQKWSANRRKANLKVAKAHERIANQRKDFLHKISTTIVKNHDTIAIEDLNVKGMLQNHKLAQAISDVSWSEFRRMLTYKCEWYGKNLIVIDRFAPSSKLCTCWYKNKDLKLSDREWTCSQCGALHDRDLLASKNIARFARAESSEVPLEEFSIENPVKEE